HKRPVVPVAVVRNPYLRRCNMRQLLEQQITECRASLTRLARRVKILERIGGQEAAQASNDLAAANLKLAAAFRRARPGRAYDAAMKGWSHEAAVAGGHARWANRGERRPEDKGPTTARGHTLPSWWPGRGRSKPDRPATDKTDDKLVNALSGKWEDAGSLSKK